MTERAFETARIDDLERPDGWSPLRLHFDVQAFGINAWTAHEADAPVIPDHHEEPSGHEELYLVTSGHATFTVEGERIDAPSGRSSSSVIPPPRVAPSRASPGRRS